MPNIAELGFSVSQGTNASTEAAHRMDWSQRTYPSTSDSTKDAWKIKTYLQYIYYTWIADSDTLSDFLQ